MHVERGFVSFCLIVAFGTACSVEPARPNKTGRDSVAVASPSCKEPGHRADCEVRVSAYAAPENVDGLVRECPDGHVVRVESTVSGEHYDVSCEDLRAFTCDVRHHDILVNVCVATRDAYGDADWTPRCDHRGENTCEARQPFTVLGILCEIALGSAVAYGCTRSFSNDPVACGAGTLGVGLVIGHFVCALF
jgi:hypothetical protein